MRDNEQVFRFRKLLDYVADTIYSFIFDVNFDEEYGNILVHVEDKIICQRILRLFYIDKCLEGKIVETGIERKG